MSARQNPRDLIPQIHAAKGCCVLAVTGGGSRAIGALLGVPGASRTVLEAVVPYSERSLIAYLGLAPHNACSERTARQMAMAAWKRARILDPERLVVGVACTAGLATDRVKLGPRRFWIAAHSAERTVVYGLELGPVQRSRSEEEDLAAERIIAVLAEMLGVRPFPYANRAIDDATGDSPTWRDARATPELTRLLLGECTSCLLPGGGTVAEPALNAMPVLFPGSFNPMHHGHREMIAVAQDLLGAPVVCELSIENVDKPPLDLLDIESRLAGMHGAAVLVSTAPTFVEKARVAPGATFVVGIDTVVRIGDSRYYGGDPTARDRAIAAIASRGCRFLVFSREVEGALLTLQVAELPDALRALSQGVPPDRFLRDISSSGIRQEMGGP